MELIQSLFPSGNMFAENLLFFLFNLHFQYLNEILDYFNNFYLNYLFFPYFKMLFHFHLQRFIIILNHLLLLEGQLWVIIFIIKMMEQEGIIIFLQIMVGCRQI